MKIQKSQCQIKLKSLKSRWEKISENDSKSHIEKAEDVGKVNHFIFRF